MYFLETPSFILSKEFSLNVRKRTVLQSFTDLCRNRDNDGKEHRSLQDGYG